MTITTTTPRRHHLLTASSLTEGTWARSVAALDGSTHHATRGVGVGGGIGCANGWRRRESPGGKAVAAQLTGMRGGAKRRPQTLPTAACACVLPNQVLKD